MKKEKSKTIPDSIDDINKILESLKFYPDDYISNNVTSEILKSTNNIKSNFRGILIFLLLLLISLVGVIILLVYQDRYTEKLIETNTVIKEAKPDSLITKILGIQTVNDSTTKYSYAVDSKGNIITYRKALKINDSLLIRYNELKKNYDEINEAVKVSSEHLQKLKPDLGKNKDSLNKK